MYAAETLAAFSGDGWRNRAVRKLTSNPRLALIRASLHNMLRGCYVVATAISTMEVRRANLLMSAPETWVTDCT